VVRSLRADQACSGLTPGKGPGRSYLAGVLWWLLGFTYSYSTLGNQAGRARSEPSTPSCRLCLHKGSSRCMVRNAQNIQFRLAYRRVCARIAA
jgi:hypothetical protein